MVLASNSRWMTEKTIPGPIGIFDSGIGGLTVMREIVKELPAYDYIYLGDNARAPYGTRSLETVYQYTLQGVDELIARGCHLIILACNTASASALRTIQQRDLQKRGDNKRVLGVIRPTTERLAELSPSGHLGLMATEATVHSRSYVIEASEYAPEVEIYQQACPLWVPLIENDEQDSEAALYFTQKYVKALLSQSPDIDAVLLACTHYPIIQSLIQSYIPEGVELISQGELVAKSLADYLERHLWMVDQISKTRSRQFLTTDDAAVFESMAARFYGEPLRAEKVFIRDLSP